ncbi:unnamed protein product, partial [Ectocarpus sp. 12 AP-2014]
RADGTCPPATAPPPRKAHREPLSSPVSLCSPVTPFGRLMRGRPQSSLLPVGNNTPESVDCARVLAMEMEGKKTGARKGN